jgi:hypothetical protein
MSQLRYEVAASGVEALECYRYVTQSGATGRLGLSDRSTSPLSLRVLQLNASFVTFHVKSPYLVIRGKQTFDRCEMSNKCSKN